MKAYNPKLFIQKIVPARVLQSFRGLNWASVETVFTVGRIEYFRLDLAREYEQSGFIEIIEKESKKETEEESEDGDRVVSNESS